MKISNERIICVTILFTVLWIILVDNGKPDDILKRIEMSYKPHYYIFFFLGYYLASFKADRRLLKSIKYIFLSALIFFIFRVFYFFYLNRPFYSIDFYCLNIFLIIGCLLFFSSADFDIAAGVRWIGVNSLPIYLYHPMVIMKSRALFMGKTNLPSWYALTIFLISLQIITIYFLGKIGIINRYVFGSSKDAR